MDNIIKHFETIESSFRKTKAITIACVAGSAVVAVVSLVFAAVWIGLHSDNVYVLDKGGAFSATVSAGGVQRDLEAIDHVTRFHEHMFNLSPSSEAIKRSVEQALVMADRSAYTYFNDLQEQGFQRSSGAGVLFPSGPGQCQPADPHRLREGGHAYLSLSGDHLR